MKRPGLGSYLYIHYFYVKPSHDLFIAIAVIVFYRPIKQKLAVF